MDPTAALDRVVAAKPGGVSRPGQQEMVATVTQAIVDRSHLLVEGGTGTGKSLGYLIPALLSGKKVVVATATKTLQNQLAEHDLPFLAEHLGTNVTWAVVKGRQSYACMAKLVERFGPELDGAPLTPGLFDDEAGEELAAVAAWARVDVRSDRDDLDPAAPDAVWRQASVSGMECPGAGRCPQGERCFAEAALDAARKAQIVVTNHHLYGVHLSSGGRVLPEHDLVIFDEAHKLEAAMSSAFGIDVGAGRLMSLAGTARHALDARRLRGAGEDPVGDLRRAADELRGALDGTPEGRVSPGTGDLGTALEGARRAVAVVQNRLLPEDAGGHLQGIARRARQQAGHLAGDIALAQELPGDFVAWVEGRPRPVLRVAPIEVGGMLAGRLLRALPTVLASATLTVAGTFAPLAARLGFVEDDTAAAPPDDDEDEPVVSRTYRSLAVPGSFDYPRQGVLYVAAGLPEPRADGYPAAAVDEIRALTAASGGRALVLTTSYRMMELVAAALEASPWPVLVQGTLPKRRLLAEFAATEASTLVATMGYWEGIDVPGPSLSLVVIDKLPFPRPDEPLAAARREAIEARGGDAFAAYDVPHAATLLAQGVGRLIRSEDDRGVVAVLDSRLSTRRYGARILRSLPPLRRTRERQQAEAFLRRRRSE